MICLLCLDYITQQLGQLLTAWADLAGVGLFGDVEVSEKIYRLLVQILDPCNILNDLRFIVNEFWVDVDSIITNNGKIYYKNSDITSKISNILKIEYNEYFYKLVETILNNIDNNNNKNHNNIINLFLSSLYICQLFEVSISIPSEKYEIGNIDDDDNFNYFNIFSIRVNNQSINETLSNVSIFINEKDTIIGRNNFLQYDNIFDCVDIIIVELINNNNNNSKSNMTSSSRVMIKILSNQTYNNNNNNNNDSKYLLKNDIVMVFDNNKPGYSASTKIFND